MSPLLDIRFGRRLSVIHKFLMNVDKFPAVRKSFTM